MKHRLWLAALAATLTVTGAVAAPAGAAAHRSLTRRLQAAVDGQVKAGVPGIVIHVVDPLRHVDWHGASGRFARGGGRRLRPGDAFRTASVTKTFTAAVVLRLVEDGRLRLDDRMATYVDPAIVARVDVLDGVSYGDQVTIRQLLNHTSGIYDYARDEGWIAEVVAHPHRRWSATQLIDEAVARGKPYFAPGLGFAYSDTGYALLGLVIERVTGGTLAAALRRYVLGPLHLRSTWLEGREPAPAGAPPRAHQYLDAADTWAWNPSFDTVGGGGLVSTAGDLTRFIRGLFGGRVFERRATLATMRVRNPFSGDYALGIEGVQKSRSRDAPTVWGHDGFFGSFMYYWPAHHASITGSTNVFQQDPQIVPAILRVLRGR